MMALIFPLILWMEMYKTIEGLNASVFISTPAYCRYKFNIQHLNWRDAHEACRSMNRTLLKVNNTGKIASIMGMATSIVNSRLPDALHFTSKIWVAAHAEVFNDDPIYFWDDCDRVDNDLEGVDSTFLHRCLALELNSSKLKIADCENEVLPYICEAQGNVPCFVPVPNWESEPAFSFFDIKTQFDNMPCSNTLCMEDCVGFQYFQTCSLLKYTSSPTSLIALNERPENTVYTIGFIGFDNFTRGPNTAFASMTKCIQSRIQPTMMIDITSTQAPSQLSVSEVSALLSTPGDVETSFTTMSLVTDDLTISQQNQPTPLLGTVKGTIVTDGAMTTEAFGSSSTTEDLLLSDSITPSIDSFQDTSFTNEPSGPSITENFSPADTMTTAATGFKDTSMSVESSGPPTSIEEPSETESIKSDSPILPVELSTIETSFTSLSWVTDDLTISQQNQPTPLFGTATGNIVTDGAMTTEAFGSPSTTRDLSLSDSITPSADSFQDTSLTTEPSWLSITENLSPAYTMTTAATGYKDTSMSVESSGPPTSIEESSQTESIKSDSPILPGELSTIESITSVPSIPMGESETTESIKTSIAYLDIPSRSGAMNSSESINSTGCMCPCSMYKNKTYTQEEVQKRIKEIKEKLTIKPKNTRAYKRSLISAPDDRISARNIGYAGVVIMIILSGLIVLMDVPRGIGRVREFIRACRDRN